MSDTFNISGLAGRARGILVARNFPVSGLNLKGDKLSAKVPVDTSHGSINFELLVGKLIASEHIAVTDLKVFCPAVREAIELTESFRADIRVAVFRQEKAPDDLRYLPNTYFLEILLLTNNDGEAVLSLKLDDHHYDRKYLDGFMSPANPMGFFHSEASASFAVSDGQAEAIRQFSEKNPGALFLQYVSPNGYYFVRVFDAELNIKFIEFLNAQFSRMCTIYPEVMLS